VAVRLRTLWSAVSNNRGPPPAACDAEHSDYRFTDSPKVGAPLSLIVVVGAAWVVSAIYG
jgi:hypothetical protein